jgi:hypothetical protein
MLRSASRALDFGVGRGTYCHGTDCKLQAASSTIRKMPPDLGTAAGSLESPPLGGLRTHPGLFRRLHLT